MKTLTLALFLAAWLPGGLLAATATTSEPRLGGVRVELITQTDSLYTCRVQYINPSQVIFFEPSRFAVTDRSYHPAFGPNCDRAATVEGTLINIRTATARQRYLYNGTLSDFRRAFWNAQHP